MELKLFVDIQGAEEAINAVRTVAMHELVY